MDQKFINIAINLAKKHLGLTGLNPSVGCVIVKNNEIIATGVTGAGGSPHAEAAAISKVHNKSLLIGASLYVSLEPCCHVGKNPPCTDIIIKNKISRVIIAQLDKNSQVYFKGIQKLRENGVLVDILEKNSAFLLYKAFFKAINSKIPYVTLKFGVSLDGKIATKNFDSKWITCEKSRIFAHYLRSINDAILIGATTLKKDNPALDCRILGLEKFSPQKFIIANDLNFDLDLKIFQNAHEISTTILLNENCEDDFSKLEKLGVKIIKCKSLSQVDLKDALTKIYEKGCNSVLIEGGSLLATNFLQQKLIDELFWIQSNKIIGNDGIAAFDNLGFDSINQVLQNFQKEELLEFDNDIAIKFTKVN